MPLVSIVIPCYNQAGFLEECLESVAAQTRGDFETIVVDDCSTEGDPAEVVRALGDDRVRAVRPERNGGLAAARNRGFREATADWVFTLDSDDKLHPEFLEAALLRREEEPDADVFFSDFWRFGDREGLWELAAQDAREFLVRRRMPGPGLLVRKALWERIGGYCEAEILRIGQEDTDFWLAALKAGGRPCHIPGPLYLYRRHGASMTARISPRYHEVRRFIDGRHREYLESLGVRRLFLADGYWRSAISRRRAGRNAAAWAFVLRAAWTAAGEVDSRALDLGRLREALDRGVWRFPAYPRNLPANA